METRYASAEGALLLPLETSLVEWKPGEVRRQPLGVVALGNFLSGMETLFMLPPFAFQHPPLETSLVEWKPTFRSVSWTMESTLGNFLSGMETVTEKTALVNRPPLETSLVEWKPGDRETHYSPASSPWKLP